VRRRAAVGTLLACGWLTPALAFTVAITEGPKALFLQVGVGSMSGGYFDAGGTPGNNTTINTVSVTVPATQLGSGVSQLLTTDSVVTASPWDGHALCSAPATTGQVYVGGFYRVPGTAGSAATLSVSTPPSLIDAKGDTIPFNHIVWSSSGNGDASATIPSGRFTGSAQTMLSVARNSWFESCLAFSYLNSEVVPAGTYTGRATFTLSAP
jgi:hypothetical protein